MGIRITYKHDHECENKNQKVDVRPDWEDGVYFPRVPICIQTGLELDQVDVERY